MTSYHIWTIGCQMNEADARHLAAELERRGLRPAPSHDDADLLVLNTCVVRQQAEDRARGRLDRARGLKRRRPGMVVALMGCLVGERPSDDLRAQFAFVDVFLPPSDPSPLIRLLDARAAPGGPAGLARRSPAGAAAAVGEAVPPAPAEPAGASCALPPSRRGAVAANVPAVLGCSHACTYCVIPYRRGAERSRPPAEILAEIRGLAAAGVREVTLLGQIVDRYGLDLDPPSSLAALLRAAAGVAGIARVRFLTSHPNWLTEEAIEAVATTPGVCPVFELPVQSGSDAVLARMRRGYTGADYRRLVDRVRARLPDAAIHTDVIVGFPGETEAQFEESVRLLEEVRADKAHVAKYSPRPKTWAARHLADDVAPEEKERRRARLDGVQTGILAARNAAYAGRSVEVLVEDRDPRSGRWRGRTPDDRLVFFADPAERRGALARVRIAWTGPFSLVGEPAVFSGDRGPLAGSGRPLADELPGGPRDGLGPDAEPPRARATVKAQAAAGLTRPDGG